MTQRPLTGEDVMGWFRQADLDLCKAILSGCNVVLQRREKQQAADKPESETVTLTRQAVRRHKQKQAEVQETSGEPS